MTVADVNLVPVVDYARLKRIAVPVKPKRTPMTTACMIMCTLGFIFIVKRYRDKRASGQSRTRDTLRA